MRAFAMALLALITTGAAIGPFLCGCDHPTHPWDGNDAAPTTMAPPTPIATLAPTASATAGVSPTSAASNAAPAEVAVDEPHPPVRVGGPWVRCYGGFHRSGDPLKDVTRLSMLCGPLNGMKRLTDPTIQGAVQEGGPALEQPFEAKRGECYRVFAVGEPSIIDLDVTIRSSRGAAIAADHGDDGWPIVQPDRPVCPLDNDRWTIEISSKKGGGKLAAEVWVLKTYAKDPSRGVREE
jgi:hypothetical protein